MDLIKNMSRKERQVRGEISKKKLKENRYTDLLQDQSIKALCNLSSDEEQNS